MEPVLDVACVNEKCSQYGVLGAGNVVLRRVYGTDSIRFVRCVTCEHEFSERNGTALFELRLPKAKMLEVVQHLAEGVGVRKTSRLTGVGRQTVGRVLRTVGKHAKEVHDRFVRGIKVEEVQFDEMWAFVKKKQESD